MINFYSCSLSWNLCLNREIHSYVSAYAKIRESVVTEKSDKIRAGRPRIVDDELLVKDWIRYQCLMEGKGLKPKVVGFCKERGIKVSTFYCAKSRFMKANSV